MTGVRNGGRLAGMVGSGPRLLAVVTLLGLFAGCASEGQQRSDPAERISFRVPADWEAAPGSNGTRFSPSGSSSREAHINVNTGDLNPRVSLEGERDVWLDAQRSAGHEVLHSGIWEHGAFEGVEYVHTAEGVFGDVVWHHVLMTDGEVRVTGFLMAAPDAYPEYREIFLKTMRSVSARRS
jgi:hypothetical protein